MKKPIITKPIPLSRWHFICLLGQITGMHPVLEQEKLEDLLSRSIIYN